MNKRLNIKPVKIFRIREDAISGFETSENEINSYLDAVLALGVKYKINLSQLKQTPSYTEQILIVTLNPIDYKNNILHES